jgi:AAA domain
VTPEELAQDGGIYDPEAPLVAARWALQQLADVVPRQVRWLVHGLIPLHALTLVAGVGGLGKSMWLLARAAELSRQGIDVIIVSFEDTAAEIIRPRVQAAGGDLTRIHVMVLADAGGLDSVQLPRDLDDLRILVQSVKAKLIIIDPVVAAIESRLDAHKDQHVRTVLAQLARLAEEEDAAVALVGHLNKAPSMEAYIRVANSVAFWNASRSVVLLTEDGDDEELRLVAQRKANWARLRPVERHRVEEIILMDTLDPETGEPIVTSRIVFVEVADDVNGADVLGPKATKTETAETLLAAMLADGDWHESAGVKMLMSAGGFSERTVQRASKVLGVEAERRGMPSSTWWRISLAGATAGLVAPSLVAPTLPPQSGATEDSAQPCGSETVAAPVAPTAPPSAVPLLGDPMFPLAIATAANAGQLIRAEFEKLLALHKLVEAGS